MPGVFRSRTNRHLHDRQRFLIAVFDERRDTCRVAANDTRDCIRTEHVAHHKRRRGISEEGHLGSAATHQVRACTLETISTTRGSRFARPGMTIIKAPSYTASNRYFRPVDRRESAPAHCWFASASAPGWHRPPWPSHTRPRSAPAPTRGHARLP